ncbi:MAG: DoxX family membrane protein [Chloroflexaceae bacterium]|jgi:thiosulfate dehydrogenase [quinone] large subunit|nr:DoxX family membrane protein [Chloroflexaceae bacterium]
MHAEPTPLLDEAAMGRRWKTVGVVTFVVTRYLFGAFFAYGCYHKIARQWLSSPVLRQHFLQRLSEIDPDCFSAAYLRHFAIPWYRPIAWVLVLGQLLVALSTLLGVSTRPGGALALFLLLNISAGSFFNPSMPPFILYALLLTAFPSGQWFGLDAPLSRRFPGVRWFR